MEILLICPLVMNWKWPFIVELPLKHGDCDLHYLLKIVIFQFAMLIYLRVLDMFGPIHELGSETWEVFHGTCFFFPICLLAKIVFPWEDDDDDYYYYYYSYYYSYYVFPPFDTRMGWKPFNQHWSSMISPCFMYSGWLASRLPWFVRGSCYVILSFIWGSSSMNRESRSWPTIHQWIGFVGRIYGKP